jgi:hypothetical protein
MKKIVRLTESDLHRIIKESVKRILKEDATSYLIFNEILEDYKAEDMAIEYGISKDEAAVEWFKGVAIEDNFEEGNLPKYNKFITDIPELDADLYYDYGAEYYFLAKEADGSAPMSI